MQSFQKILALFLLSTAAPVAGKMKSYKDSRPGQPWAACEIKEGDVRDAYRLRAANWNITEAQLKAAINTSGTVLTGWEWNDTTYGGAGKPHIGFQVKFKLPINMEKETKKKFMEIVEPWDMWIIPYIP